MRGAFFYIEYNDGTVTQIEFKTLEMARKAYNLYAREPEDNSKAYGYEVKCEPLTLSQQIRAKKMTKELV